ncbi:unnamed protein product [Rhodiola kirilowii]
MCPELHWQCKLCRLHLRTWFSAFDWEVGKGGKVSMDEGSGLTLPRAHPLICVPVVRLDPFPST